MKNNHSMSSYVELFHTKVSPLKLINAGYNVYKT